MAGNDIARDVGWEQLIVCSRNGLDALSWFGALPLTYLEYTFRTGLEQRPATSAGIDRALHALG
eukprot:469171-Rhodomonas_salina.1